MSLLQKYELRRGSVVKYVRAVFEMAIGESNNVDLKTKPEPAGKN